MLLRSCGQSSDKDLPCRSEASSHLGWTGGGEVVMGHGQVMVCALIQDEMTTQRSINILSYYFTNGWCYSTEMKGSVQKSQLPLPDQGQSPFFS